MKFFATSALGLGTLLVLTCACTKSSAPDAGAPTAVSPSSAASQTAPPAENSWKALASADYPEPSTGLPADLPQTAPGEKHVVLAWNDLGMHCYQADFSRFQILPPYNVFWAQVIARGEKPAVATADLEVHYETLNMKNPQQHTNFWDHAAGYGWEVEPGVGLKGHRTSGVMETADDHFVAEGVPVVDFTDAGVWDPFPMFTASVKNAQGEVLAETINVAPASTEMACDLCHKADSMQGTMAAILKAHDTNEMTGLLAQAESGKPVMCSSCHADPALGVTENRDCKTTLSGAMHSFHAKKLAETEAKLPKNSCHACHPGPKTNCLRDVMSQAGLTCTNCHGGMEDVGNPERTPWVNMPTCSTCHTEALQEPAMARIKRPNEHLTADMASLYRNSKAHGGGGIYCAACHGSPHAVTPTSTERDNEQAIRLQGHKGPIDQCTLCHLEKPDKPFWHYKTAE